MLKHALAALLLSLVSSQTTPPFPKLPDSFSTVIEASLLERNITIHVEDYQDLEPGVIEVSSFHASRNGSSTVTVTEILSDAAFQFHADLLKRTCHARNLSQHTRSTLIGPDGRFHLKRTADFFRFGKQYHTAYHGEATIRGIRCERYESRYENTTNGVYSNYTMNWYFAHPDWTMPLGRSAGDYSIPVRLELVGSTNGSHRHGRPTPAGHIHDFTHYYDFIDFVPGHEHIRKEVFNLPDGIPCTNLPSIYKEKLPTLPDSFTFHARHISDHDSVSYSSTFAYDADRKETAVEHSFEGLAGYHRHDSHYGKHRIIHNFREGTQYNITYFSCKVDALSDVARTKTFHDLTLLNGHVQLSSPGALFMLGEHLNYTFQGIRTIDGVQADLWIVHRNDVQLIKSHPPNQPSFFEYYFSHTPWELVGKDGRLITGQVPLLIESHSLIPGFEHVHHRLMIDSFEVGAPEQRFFDDGPCFNSKQQSVEKFTMDTDSDNALKLEASIADKLTSVMEVTHDRFEAITYPGPDNLLTVLLRIHDVPTKGDPSLLRLLTSREDATRKLRRAISSGRFEVSANGVSAEAKRYSHSSSSHDEVGMLTSGQAAGLSVGLLLVGLVGGVGAFFLWQKRVSDNVPYKAQG